MMTMMMMGCPK